MRRFIGLLREAGIEYERDRARYLAVAIIYYAMVSLVPLLLLLLAALGLLLRFSATAEGAQERMLLTLEASFGAQLPMGIHQLLDSLKRQSIIAMLVGLTGLLLSASVLFMHLRLTFRAIWNYDPPLAAGTVRLMLRTTILERIIAFVMVLAGGALLIAALAMIAATQWLNRLAGVLPLPSQATEWLLAALSSLILAAVTFACLFKFLPPVRIRWRDVWLASLLCAMAWVAAAEFLTFYAVFMSDSLSAYGALGGLLAVMFWMNIVSQALFFGAELCKVTAKREGS